MTIFLKKLILYWGGDIFGPRDIIWINLVDGPQGYATYQSLGGAILTPGTLFEQT